MVSTLSLTLVSFLKCINLITLRQGSDAVLHMFMLTSCSTFQLTAVKHKNRESSGGIAIEQAKNCSGVVLILSPPPP